MAHEKLIRPEEVEDIDVQLVSKLNRPRPSGKTLRREQIIRYEACFLPKEKKPIKNAEIKDV